MIRYYVIIAVSLIYPHWTNAAAWFNDDIEEIQDHIRDERDCKCTCAPRSLSRTMSIGSAPEEREDILCDRLSNEEKQSICDEIMQNLIFKRHGRIFRAFLDSDNLPSPPSGDPYACKERSIYKLDMEKRMFLCKSRWFRKGAMTHEYGLMEGFFCAGSRKTDGRVFAFRPPVMDNRKKHPVEVSPVAELDNVEEILQYVRRFEGSEKSCASTASLEKSE